MYKDDKRFLYSVKNRMLFYFKTAEIRETLFDLGDNSDNNPLYLKYASPRSFVQCMKETMESKTALACAKILAVWLVIVSLFCYHLALNNKSSLYLLFFAGYIMYFLALKDWLLTGIIRPSKKDLRFSLVSQVFIAVYEITYLLLSNVYIVDMVFNDVDPWKIWISTKTIFYMFSSSAVFILLIFLYKYLFKCKVWLGPMVIQTLFFFIAVNGWHKVWSNVEISHFAPRTDVLPIVVSIIVSIIWPIVYQKWGD